MYFQQNNSIEEPFYFCPCLDCFVVIIYLLFQANVRSYYQQFEEQQTQSLIDQRIKEHLSGQGAFQIGAAYVAWRPGLRPPILPAPLPIPGAVPPNAAMAPGIRLPVLPRPPGMPGKFMLSSYVCVILK